MNLSEEVSAQIRAGGLSTRIRKYGNALFHHRGHREHREKLENSTLCELCALGGLDIIGKNTYLNL